MKKVCVCLGVLLCMGVGTVKSQFTVLHNFNDTNGREPHGDVTLAGNKLYGMTRYGGTYNGGVIFSIDTNGKEYRDLLDFDSINVAEPLGSLLSVGKLLYGMTRAGGKYHSGCVFSIDTDGSGYRDLLDFNVTNGGAPWGSLILSGKALYGMTYFGGPNNFGCVFSVDTDGSKYKELIGFNGTTGGNPCGSLILSGGVLYGMTEFAGYWGNIFSIDTDGSSFKDLFEFSNNAGGIGMYPYGSLVKSENKLYGMTSQGGMEPGPGGCIFSIDTDGNDYKCLYELELPLPHFGTDPYGSLILSGNLLYGMTYVGGVSGGAIFAIDTTGNERKVLWDFNSSGSTPWGDLTLSGKTLYGMTSAGGTHGYGVIFKIDTTAKVEGVDELNTNSGGVRVYPNPNNGIFTLTLPSPFGEGVTTVEIYNMLGELIKSEKLGGKSTIIDISNQAAGIYLYRVLTENGTLISSGKFIVE